MRRIVDNHVVLTTKYGDLLKKKAFGFLDAFGRYGRAASILFIDYYWNSRVKSKASNLQSFSKSLTLLPLNLPLPQPPTSHLLPRPPYKRNNIASTYNNIPPRHYFSTMQQPTQKPYLIHQNNTALFAQGHAKIYTKYLQKNAEGQTIQNEVFYNPVQVFNRDFSILMMQGYIDQLKIEKGDKFKGVSIADCLSASGLRTIRYIKELQGVKVVYANDILPAAGRLMKDNFDLNSLDKEKFKITLKDANVLMRESYTEGGFDIIDLDPYGSVVPFLDSALGSIKEGGLLCITCTDTRVLCGPDLTKCFYFYGTTRAKVHDFNENALRVLMYTISSTASRHCKYIVPLLSLQTDFYVRVFVRVFAGKKECGQTGIKIGNIYNCEFCGNYEYQSFFKPKNKGFVPQRTLCSSINCPICSHSFQLNGPVWLDKINDQSFAQKMMDYIKSEQFKLPLATKKKIYGVLHGIVAEGELAKVPLAFNFDLMNKAVHSTGLSRQNLINAVKSLGKEYLISPSYLSPGFYKTTLPLEGIYDIIKAWKLKEMGEEKFLSNIKQEHALNILKREIKYTPDFAFKSEEKFEKVPRFISMGKGMGPKGKAGRRVVEQSELQQIQQDKQLNKIEIEDKEDVSGLPTKRPKQV